LTFHLSPLILISVDFFARAGRFFLFLGDDRRRGETLNFAGCAGAWEKTPDFAIVGGRQSRDGKKGRRF
jgi:hypothetical protein